MGLWWRRAGLLAVVALLPTAGRAQKGSLRLDHVPIAVDDLEAAARHYHEVLGFSLKPGRLHANSVNNVHIKFADGSALELITASEPRDAQAARYLQFLEGGEGPACLALGGGEAEELAARLRAADFHPTVTRGSYYASVTFGDADGLPCLFFSQVFRRPPDLPEHLGHANGAVRLAAAWVTGENRLGALLNVLGAPTREAVSLPPGVGKETVLEGGHIYHVTPPDSLAAGRFVWGVTLEVIDIGATTTLLEETLGASFQHGEDARGTFLRVPPAQAHGSWIEFLELR